jgi:ABC-type Fe3+ transport system permease subunit
VKHWRMLVGLFLALSALVSTHLGYVLWNTKFPNTALLPWMLSISLVLIALVFAQEDGFRVGPEGEKS